MGAWSRGSPVHNPVEQRDSTSPHTQRPYVQAVGLSATWTCSYQQLVSPTSPAHLPDCRRKNQSWD